MLCRACIKAPFTRNGSEWNRTSTVRTGLAFTREVIEPLHTEPLAVPEWVHLQNRSRMEPK